MKKYVLVFCFGFLSILCFSQRTSSDTLALNGTIMKLPKERFAQAFCISEAECFVLNDGKEDHILNTTHPFTLKLAQDNLNKKVLIKGIYTLKPGSSDSESKKCNVLTLIPNRVKLSKK